LFEQGKGAKEEAEATTALDDVEVLNDLSDDAGATEEVCGDWQYLKTPEKQGGERTTEKDESGGTAAGLSLEERMNAELDASVGEKKGSRRQNSTLEDFFTSPKRTTAKARPYSKRAYSPRAIVSPPHKTHRVFSPRHNENRSTGRFIKEVCQKLNEPKQHLMRKVMEQVGKIFIMELVDQVERVEEEGGQFVADGTRRRTKGGVFLNLLKAQVTKEQWDTIFEDEKEAQKRRKAMKRRLRYAGEAGSQAEKDGAAPSAANFPVSYKDCLTSNNSVMAKVA